MKHTNGVIIQDSDTTEQLQRDKHAHQQRTVWLIIISAAIGTVVLSTFAISAIVRAGILQRFQNTEYTTEAADDNAMNDFGTAAQTVRSSGSTSFLSNYVIFWNSLPQ